MAYQVPAAYQNALRTSHVVEYRVTAYSAIQGVMPDVPISNGSVSYDAGSDVRRSAELTIGDPSLWPADPLAVLSPIGSEIGIEYGIVVPSLPTAWVPLIRGPVQTAKRSRPAADAAITLTVADRSSWVAEDKFEATVQTVADALVVDEIRRLITESRPTVTVTDLTGSTTVAAQIEIDKERWKDGVGKLAETIGAEVYADRFGGFVIAPAPTFTGSPVWTIDAGSEGVLVKIDEELSRERVYNAVVASGERTNGDNAVYARVTDTDPGSPTYYGGPFGRRPFFFSSSALDTHDKCVTAATARLNRVRGLQATVSLDTITNPCLDAGDLIAVVDRDGATPQLHVVDKVGIPLDPTATQSISTRSINDDALDTGQ